MSLIRTRHTWLLLAIAVGALGAVWPWGMPVAIHAHHWPSWFGFIPWFIYAAMAYGAGRFYQETWRNREGAVRANAEGLYLDDRLLMSRRALRHGHIMTEGDRTFLRLHRRAPFAAPYDVEVADEAEARLLLASLRLDAQTSVSEFELRAGTMRRALVLRWLKIAVSVPSLFVLPGFAHRFGENAAIASFFAACLLCAYFMTSNVIQVAVGADGLHVKPTFGRSRFLAYSDIDDVRLEGKNLHLDLADGTTVALHRADEGAALEQRIREALSVHRARNVNVASAMNRGGRTTAEWLEATKDRSATYRRAVVPNDELWTIVEDAAASPTERAGAALALRMELDEPGRDRLRIAAGACAEKKLRVALESVATNADDAELAEVLEPLEDRRVRKLSRS